MCPWLRLLGAPITYTDWAENRPQSINTGQRCILLNEFQQWDDADCTVPNPFVCQYGQCVMSIWSVCDVNMVSVCCQ